MGVAESEPVEYAATWVWGSLVALGMRLSPVGGLLSPKKLDRLRCQIFGRATYIYGHWKRKRALMVPFLIQLYSSVSSSHLSFPLIANFVITTETGAVWLEHEAYNS